MEFRHRMMLQKNGRQGKKGKQRAAESKTRISKYKQTKQQVRLLEMSYGRFSWGSALLMNLPKACANLPLAIAEPKSQSLKDTTVKTETIRDR